MGKWLVKSEPESYSIDALERDGRMHWDGVRNHQAQMSLRAMRTGDPVLFYHSVTGKAIVGLARVAREHYPDPTDPTGKWGCVDLEFAAKFERPMELAEIKEDAELSNLGLVRQSRLSVMPVEESHWKLLRKRLGF